MKYQTGIVACVPLLFLFLSACGTGAASVSSEQELLAATPLPVEVATPSVADIFATYESTAKIAADAEAPVIARAEGQIVEIVVEEGDLVSAGQLLARLDGDRSRLQMIQAKINLEKATREHERQTSLRERGLVSAASLETLQYEVASLQATYDLRRLNYEYTMIKAPIAGVVASRDVKSGAHVKMNDAVFSIANTERLVAHLKIPQTELSKFSAGHRASVRVDYMPDVTFDAQIARISPTIDPRTGTFRATVYIDNANRDLAPGMFGRFSVAYEKHSAALLVPKDAIVSEDNEKVVYVVENGAALRRPVTTGIESSDMIEILEGLTPDEQVIISGQTGLRDGSKVLASAGQLERVSG
jgi:membrane fusion protein (multidrug efflux system)